MSAHAKPAELHYDVTPPLSVLRTSEVPHGIGAMLGLLPCPYEPMDAAILVELMLTRDASPDFPMRRRGATPAQTESLKRAVARLRGMWLVTVSRNVEDGARRAQKHDDAVPGIRMVDWSPWFEF